MKIDRRNVLKPIPLARNVRCKADPVNNGQVYALSTPFLSRKTIAGFLMGLCREIVFIDDLERNVAGAQACGWSAIHHSSPLETRRSLRALGVRLPDSFVFGK